MRNRYVLLLDLPVIALAATGAFILRFDWLSPSSRAEFLPFLLAALLIKPPVFQAFGLYRRYWSYASAADLVAVFVGVTAASVALGLTVGVAMLTRTVMQRRMRTRTGMPTAVLPPTAASGALGIRIGSSSAARVGATCCFWTRRAGSPGT